MAHRYAPLSNPRQQHDREVEMQAAFDYSDDEEDENNVTERHPLNPTSTSPAIQQPPPHVPGTYNFESVDYDYPPPGSPPRPSAVALPNEFGNSNGLIPTFHPPQTRGPNQMWLQRTAGAILPTSVLAAIGMGSRRPSGPIGGGTNNDGVFANVTAKPTAPARVQDGDETYLVPEDSRQEAPPSYASAQADAVPPYWETTVHAPFSPDSIGDMVIDSLPTGSLFSFCWNLLVSISFQFVGFLLTYLLHTSHAARLGSRAGLGVTLIQYGFALRSRLDSNDGTGDTVNWSDWNTNAGSNAVENPPIHQHMGNVTWTTPVANMTEEQSTIFIADATTEWLSFFLMTVGWFVLLTSLLGFWRVKRWEQGILASRENASATPVSRVNSAAGFVFQLESSLSLRGLSRADLYQGFGLGSRNRQENDAEHTSTPPHTPEGSMHNESPETEPMMPQHSSTIDPAIARAFANEQRLQRDLREAGLL